MTRLFDVLLSGFGLLFGWPILALVYIAGFFDTGSPLFHQERVGRHQRSFILLKFRTMRTGTKSVATHLATASAVTKLGSFLRRSKLDELPQLWNVLKGEMSLVGPRPERKFFIDQIVQIAPHYKHLHRVKPGITSWGQVKYGYAENVSEMIERLKYDLLYIENMSLMVDLKILIYTVLIVVQGRGK